MHNIHAYPAKFPAFIASKVFDYARKENVDVKSVADIFCGCGTVALEAKLHNYSFWGCDINPVATLIARVKSGNYNINVLNKYYTRILETIVEADCSPESYINANERLQYWFDEHKYLSLLKIKNAINNVPKGKYRDAFLCIFSAILKSTSRWLSKSIKPQIDPNKIPMNPEDAFKKQYNKFVKSSENNSDKEQSKTYNIQTGNFLTLKNIPKVDLIVSSPPYATSYEYADLHQLSTLWLDYTDDYKTYRKGTIGSMHNSENLKLEGLKLNSKGQQIVKDLIEVMKSKSRVKSVARYYEDMQKVVKKCTKMLKKNGMVFFVVGNTEFKGIKIENSRHLVEAMMDCGLDDIKIDRRKISNKLLTPYRDSNGKFTTDKEQRQIYHEELLISGRKH
ncbi:MAG: class I SAM-dependent methyltransferase [Endomicrobia bacterium]|nr:class I SAM-dependent methyltransferase [Endomicrobiia bacterium]